MAEGEVVMDGRRFGRLCAGIGRLTVGQMRALRRRLRGLDARTELPARIDARAQALQRCLHGGATALRRWGGTRSGPRRRRCRGCRRTFSAASGTALARVRRPEQVQLALADMRSRRPSSCRAPAPRRGVDKMTVWRWRRRLLAGLAGIGATRLHGIVEADEKDFRESRKGSREWVNHERNPALFPKPDRPRWRDDQRLGLLRPAAARAAPTCCPSAARRASSPCSSAVSARMRRSARTATALTTCWPGHGPCRTAASTREPARR
jgi:transposase-like protein